ncbi:MAG: hypothetical protein LBR80_14700 [Deltaproteobacteria bacterium]|jgi:hypothetical protein|nr:hypothetical protein [Deltaproteobacteria bacterium]
MSTVNEQIEHDNGWEHMSNRKYIKSGKYTMVDAMIGKVQKFITFQKFSFELFEYGKAAAHNMDAANIFTIGTLDTPHET